MPDLSHIVWIDESGNGRRTASGQPVVGIQSLWISVAVGFRWNQIPNVRARVETILRDRFRNRCSELKASHIRRYLPPEFSCDHVAFDVSQIVQELDGHVWITGTRAGSKVMFRHPKGEKAEAKDKTRQLLIERISGYASPRFFEPSTWVIVWDVDDAGSLGEFSAAVGAFRNRISGYPLPSAIAPYMLGALSHEWSPIQIADVYANFALHKVGIDLGLPDAKAERASAFAKYLHPTLQRDNSGKIVGWKIW